jgi:hypothetical protein
MPRVKKNSDAKPVKKPVKKNSMAVKIAKPAVKAIKSVAKPPVKTLKKKARPVVIDVIEDDESEAFFPEFPELRKGAIAEDMAIDEVDEENEETEKNKEEGEPERAYPVEELDQQKKFFSKLISEKTEKNSESESNNNDDDIENEPVTKKSVGLYRRLVWRFIGLTCILLLIVFYFSFSKLTINISPNGEALNDSLLIKIEPEGMVDGNASSTDANASTTDFREKVDGTVKEMEVNEEKTFPSSGEESIGEEISGKVTLINNSAKSQTLVATTRLLSADNKLFRIKNAVNIPAGGSVDAEIYADKPSEDLAITPTSFTIPGLWLGLQDKIFAKSTTTFVYQQKVKKYIKASDIDDATKEMNDVLLTKVKQGQSEDITTGVIYETLDPISIETSAKAGDAADEFTVKAKEDLVIITYSKKEVAKLASDKLALLVPDDKELAGYDENNISYTFDSYDPKTGIASVKASFSGTMVLKNGTEIIDKKQLVNLNRDQLENYLKTFPEIKTFELKFFPSFITRAPRLPERIEVKIN